MKREWSKPAKNSLSLEHTMGRYEVITIETDEKVTYGWSCCCGAYSHVNNNGYPYSSADEAKIDGEAHEATCQDPCNIS